MSLAVSAPDSFLSINIFYCYFYFLDRNFFLSKRLRDAPCRFFCLAIFFQSVYIFANYTTFSALPTIGNFIYKYKGIVS